MRKVICAIVGLAFLLPFTPARAAHERSVGVPAGLHVANVAPQGGMQLADDADGKGGGGGPSQPKGSKPKPKPSKTKNPSKPKPSKTKKPSKPSKVSKPSSPSK